MSQIYKRVTSGSLPPDVPTTFTADTGVATPAANNLNVFGQTNFVDDAAGIRTEGIGDTLLVQLTNRIQGNETTVGLTTADVITFNLSATPGAYKMHFEVVAFESTTPAGLGYSIEASARSDGATATVIEDPDADEDEDPALQTDADWSIVAVGNSVVLRVTGVTGLTLNWNSVMTYIYRG